MSIEEIQPPRMPQPEQWMSEHPFASLLLLVAVIVGLILLVEALS